MYFNANEMDEVKLYLDDVLSLKRGGCLNLDSTVWLIETPFLRLLQNLPIQRSRIGFVVDTMPRSLLWLESHW